MASVKLSDVVTLSPSTYVRSINYNIDNHKYHDIECCEWTRGIDNLLANYTDDRIIITDLIDNDPETLISTIWKQDGPLAIDNSCQCQMGKGNRRSIFSCAQCTNLRRLIDLRLGGTDQPFQIECGESTGKKLIVTESDINTPFLSWDEASSQRARIYHEQYHNLVICGSNYNPDMRCIIGDPFTIKTLITWMISKIFNDDNIPNFIQMHTAFICNNIGYSLYDMPGIGTIYELHKLSKYHEDKRHKSPKLKGLKHDESIQINFPKHIHRGFSPIENINEVARIDSNHRLKSEIANDIIIQLLVIMSELSKINFSHGTPSIHSLIFDDVPVSYVYDNVHIDSQITVKISDMNNSSATFNNVHYFPENFNSKLYIERHMFVPEIVTKNISMAHCQKQSNPLNDAKVISHFSNNYAPSQNKTCSLSTCSSSASRRDVSSASLTLEKLDSTFPSVASHFSRGLEAESPADLLAELDSTSSRLRSANGAELFRASSKYDICIKRNVTVYRLTNSTVDIYNAMRHIGFPIYTGSFDFYCFMTGLMCDRPFYDAVVNDERLYRLWSMMWLIDDFENIESLVKKSHGINFSNDPKLASKHVVDIIRGAW